MQQKLSLTSLKDLLQLVAARVLHVSNAFSVKTLMVDYPF